MLQRTFRPQKIGRHAQAKVVKWPSTIPCVQKRPQWHFCQTQPLAGSRSWEVGFYGWTWSRWGSGLSQPLRSKRLILMAAMVTVYCITKTIRTLLEYLWADLETQLRALQHYSKHKTGQYGKVSSLENTQVWNTVQVIDDIGVLGRGVLSHLNKSKLVPCQQTICKDKSVTNRS